MNSQLNLSLLNSSLMDTREVIVDFKRKMRKEDLSAIYLRVADKKIGNERINYALSWSKRAIIINNVETVVDFIARSAANSMEYFKGRSIMIRCQST